MPTAKLIAILLLRAGPQDLPYSAKLSVQITVIYVLTDYLMLQSSQQGDTAGLVVLDVALLLGYSYLLLLLLGLKPRYTQTVAALAGTGIIFNLLSWPLVMQLGAEDMQQAVSTLMILVIFMLMSWNVLVNAHIFRHALATSMLHAILLSFALLFLSIALTRFFFPEA